MTDQWPNQISSVKFQIKPKDIHCRIQYTQESNKINIIDWNDGSMIDIMQLDDVIGADLELLSNIDIYDVNGMNVDSRDEFWEESKSNPNNEVKYDSVNATKALLNIYSYPHKVNEERIPHHVTLEVLSDDTNKTNDTNINQENDFTNVKLCIHSIRTLANLGHFSETVKKPPCYLVIVNPFSGRGKGKQIYDDMIKIMLDESGIDHRVLITQHAGHAADRMLSKQKDLHPNSSDNLEDSEECDISSYDAVIVVGGDGILFEILQGIHRREDASSILSLLKFGIVGSGTCNGLAKSLQHASDSNKKYYTVRESIFLICKGKTSPMDLSLYQTLSKNKSYLGFLTFSWAIISDVDIESEVLRFVGSLRIELWTVWRILNLKTYHGKFSYLPPSFQGNKDVTPEWKTIEDEFLLLWVSQVTHASYNVHNSPTSKLNDGLFKALIIRRNKCSRLKLVAILLSLEYGTHVQYEECEVYDCVAFRFEPISVGSYNNLDGERIDDGVVHAKVLPSAINIFANAS